MFKLDIMFNIYNIQNTHVLGSVTSDFQVKKLDLERLSKQN